MDKQIVDAIILILVVAGSRILSHFEHKKTSKQVADIYILMNGETTRKVADAYQQGRQDQIKAEKGIQ